jgi:hypothetical protein
MEGFALSFVYYGNPHLQGANPTAVVTLTQDQIPPDFVVKSQAIDVAEVILALIRQPNVVSTLWRNRQSRRERLSTSETHGSTTKSGGIWTVRLRGTIARVDGSTILGSLGMAY